MSPPEKHDKKTGRSEIEINLRSYSEEVDLASFTFYSWKAIKNNIASDREALTAINSNSLAWGIILYSLGCSFFVNLGRIFDTDSGAFSIFKLLQSCQTQIADFSKDQLRLRKLALGLDPDSLDNYISSAYEATAKDFRIIREEVSKRANLFQKIYQPIRHKIYAHKEIEIIESHQQLFDKTQIGQVQEMLSFLYGVEQFVFELYHNGRKTDHAKFKCDDEDRTIKDIASLMGKIKRGYKPSQG
jgi:hypothetical protein